MTVRMSRKKSAQQLVLIAKLEVMYKKWAYFEKQVFLT